MRQRRVGTFTLGLMLILIGIMVPLALYFKEQALLILQFSPIILVVLGVEILIYNIKFKDEKLKYDGLSIFLSIVITVVTIGAASITPIISNYIDYSKTVNTQAKDGRDRVESLMRKNKMDGYSEVYCINGYYEFVDYDAKTLPINVNVNFTEPGIGESFDMKAIAKKIRLFLSDLDSQDIPYENIGINVTGSENDYETGVSLNKYDVKSISEEDIVSMLEKKQ